MDPSIMKLLEEDEDETMHSGADVEAFTAALNRDIEGDSSSFQPSDSDTAFSQGSNHSMNRFPQWQTSNLDENTSSQSQQGMNNLHQQDIKTHISGSQNQQQQQLESLQEAKQKSIQIPQSRAMHDSENKPNPNAPRVQETERAEQHVDPRLQKMTSSNQQAINMMNRNKQVPFALLVPVIEPQLDREKAVQFQAVYSKLKQNEISKDVFVRHMRNIVGDHVLKMAVYKLQAQSVRLPQSGPSHFTSQHMQMPPTMSSQIHTKGPNSSSDQPKIPSTAGQVLNDASNLTTIANNTATQSESHGVQGSQLSGSSFAAVKQEQDRAFPIQGLNKQQQQHLHFPQSSFATFGNSGGTSNYPPYSSANMNSSSQSSQQIRQVPVQPTSQAMNTMNRPDFETKRLQGGSLSNLSCNPTMQHNNSGHWQPSANKEQKNGGGISSMGYVKQEQIEQGTEQQKPSQLSARQGLSSFPPVEQGNTTTGNLRDESFDATSSRTGFSGPQRSITAQLELNASLNTRIQSTSSVGLGGNLKQVPKKPSTIGQKKPLEALGSSPPLAGKKQKVSGAFSDQSIEQLNDVTAVSGVNLREEEEQLFSGPKEDSQVSEASRRVVQEEEDRLFLQKAPLHKKLAEIISKSGLKGVSADVERCLSLCVEERIRGLLCNMVRLSKQRVDIEKPRHRTVVTSDVGQQIMMMNRKTREEWEQKQADEEKLQKNNESDGNAGVDGDKDEGRGKSVKMQANKEEDDKMRTTAANVAARAAVGGDDMLSKWQLMAEQARQKREGGPDLFSSVTQPTKETGGGGGGRKSSSATVKSSKDHNNQEGENRSSTGVTPSGVRKSGKSQYSASQTRVARSISVKDVIAVLEREPQLSKSTLIYRLYEKICSEPAPE